MAMIEEKNIDTYLTDLFKRLKHVNKDLAGVLESEKTYLEAKIENGLFSELYVGPSGFPSAPSLKADLKNIYEQSKKYDRKAKKVVEKLKSGSVSSEDEFSLKMGSIYVPTQVIEGFVTASISKNGEYSQISAKNIEEKKDGWFYVTEQKKTVKNLEEIQGVGVSLIENWDEIAGLAASGGACFLLGPLGLAIYPAWMVLKYSKNDRRKRYLFKDMYLGAKQTFKRKKNINEKKLKKSPDSTTAEAFKFFHPLVDEELSEPVLLYKDSEGKVKIVDGEYSALEKELRDAVDDNNTLMKRTSLITLLGGIIDGSYDSPIKLRDDFDLPRFGTISKYEKHKEISKIMEVLEVEKQKLNAKPELYQMSEEQIDEVAKILKGCLSNSHGKSSIVKPEEAYVDKLGTVYPALPFWVSKVSSSGGTSLDMDHTVNTMKEFQKLFLEYLFNESTIPLTTFLQNSEVADDVIRNFEKVKLPAMYVYVDKEQFRKPEPEQMYVKLQAFGYSESFDRALKNSLSLRANFSTKIEQLAKKPHYKNLFNDVSMIELDRPDKKSGYHGRLKELADLKSSIDSKISNLETQINGHKLSQNQIQEKTTEIAGLQKKMLADYGKLAPEAIDQLRLVTVNRVQKEKKK
ncbi:MAG: hypothetical protein L6408_07595 [Nanoarchaeota archaeon]|nr:hypothetical protein [Nanoarchaeota archaeon]